MNDSSKLTIEENHANIALLHWYRWILPRVGISKDESLRASVDFPTRGNIIGLLHWYRWLLCSIQLFHACLGNSQNCYPEVPWTARCTSARGRKQWCIELSTVPLNWHATSEHITYLVTFDVILVMFDVTNQAIGKTISRCFSITFIWVTSQTWCSRFCGPAGDVIWATFHVCVCGVCQLSYN